MKMLGLLVGGLLWAAAATASAAPTTCDRLASHPDDPHRNSAGLETEEIDLRAAEAACRRAVAEDPRSARARYHLGRVLYYQGQVEPSVSELRTAADTGYPQAIFVLGYLHADGKARRDDCLAGSLWLRSAALERPWSGYHLVDKALAGRFERCEFKLSPADLERYMRLAEEHITLAGSGGRVEKLRARLNERSATPRAAAATGHSTAGRDRSLGGPEIALRAFGTKP